MKGKRAFLYVQHLLGIGHLRRMASLANSLAEDGADVTLASGGFPVPGLDVSRIRFIQLPPAAAADLTFRSLVDPGGAPVDEAWKAARRDQLLAAWRETDAHALVIELFPFGRRQMRFELVPLLDEASTAVRRPVIVSSVRDVLGGGQKDPARQLEMLAHFEKYFDKLLVHGDESVIPFSRTFRYADKLGRRLFHTGYISERNDIQDAPSETKGPEKSGIVVSAGGGAVGRRLLETAIRAHSLPGLRGIPCRILCGVNAPAGELDRLLEIAAEESNAGVVVERARPDFLQLLRRCAVSVSQAGYNTMMDIVTTGVRSVVVPFAGGGETEQAVRAESFAAHGTVEVVSEADLAPETLAAAINRAWSSERGPSIAVDCSGAQRSAELLSGWMAERAW